MPLMKSGTANFISTTNQVKDNPAMINVGTGINNVIEGLKVGGNEFAQKAKEFVDPLPENKNIQMYVPPKQSVPVTSLFHLFPFQYGQWTEAFGWRYTARSFSDWLDVAPDIIKQIIPDTKRFLSDLFNFRLTEIHPVLILLVVVFILALVL